MFCYVILHFNSIEETINCTKSILKLDGDKKIIIVDNASSDKSGELLYNMYEKHTEVVVILNKLNEGFARGNNLGYKYARQNFNPEFIVVMNNDMKINTINFKKNVEECYVKTQFSVMAPDVYSLKYFYHQNPQRKNNYTLRELKRLRNVSFLKNHLKWLYWIKWNVLPVTKKKSEVELIEKESIKIKTSEEYIENFPLHGSFYIFSKHFINERESCFYDKTFMYMESYILHYECMRDNLKMIYNPSISVEHYEDVATDKTFKDRYRKAVFTNKCMMDSCNEFIKLREYDEKRKEVIN